MSANDGYTVQADPILFTEGYFLGELNNVEFSPWERFAPHQ